MSENRTYKLISKVKKEPVSDQQGVSARSNTCVQTSEQDRPVTNADPVSASLSTREQHSVSAPPPPHSNPCDNANVAQNSWTNAPSFAPFIVSSVIPSLKPFQPARCEFGAVIGRSPNILNAPTYRLPLTAHPALAPQTPFPPSITTRLGVFTPIASTATTATVTFSAGSNATAPIVTQKIRPNYQTLVAHSPTNDFALKSVRPRNLQQGMCQQFAQYCLQAPQRQQPSLVAPVNLSSAFTFVPTQTGSICSNSVLNGNAAVQLNLPGQPPVLSTTSSLLLASMTTVLSSTNVPPATFSTASATHSTAPQTEDSAVAVAMPKFSRAPVISNSIPIVSDGLFWNQISRCKNGHMMFPGLENCYFSSPESVLRSVRSAASPDTSLSLQLPSSVLDLDLERPAQLNNWLVCSSVKDVSRQGFHVCLGCQQSFTCKAHYDSHMSRPVARIFYRCHLCRGSETAHISSTDEAEETSVTSVLTMADCAESTAINNNTNTNNINSRSVHSPYYAVLYGGIIKASNRCAIFAHMASAHPNEPQSSWALRPSLLTVCPLSDSAWTSNPLRISRVHDYLSLGQQQEIVQAPSTTEATNVVEKCASIGCAMDGNGESAVPETVPDNVINGTSNAAESDTDDYYNEDGVISRGTLKKTDHSAFYRSGAELSECLRDLERVIYGILPHHGLDFVESRNMPFNLGSYIRLTDTCEERLFGHDHDFPLLISPLKRLYDCGQPDAGTQQSSGGSHDRLQLTGHSDFFPRLPSPKSALGQLILHCANMPTWQSHMFLTGWVQNTSEIKTHQNVSLPVLSSSAEAILSERDESETGDSDDATNPEGYEVLLPVAPSISQLNKVFPQIARLRFTEAFDSDTSVADYRNSSSVLPSSTAPSMNPTRCTSSQPPILPSPESSSGFFRCLICPFQASTAKQLSEHLSGSAPFMLTRCALCGQCLWFNPQSNLCAVKAHLMLHLNTFLMCPQCGFTPPAYLPPDAYELCLRIHLRFVCFHFNLLQVYICTRCPNGTSNGKAYGTVVNLCQHYFDAHAKRVLVCLWCTRQTQSDEPALSTNVNDASTDTLTDITKFAAAAPTAVETSCHDTCSPVVLRTSTNKGEPNQAVTECVATPTFSSSSTARHYVRISSLLQHFRNAHQHVLWIPSSSSSLDASSTHTLESIPTVSCIGSESKQQQQQHSVGINNKTMAQNSPPVHHWDDDGLRSTDQNTENNVVVESGSRATTAANLLLGVDYAYMYQCPECDQKFADKVQFTEHVSAVHRASCCRVYCYRCFGSCKRLSYDISEFRQHLSICQHAKKVYLATFVINRYLPNFASKTKSISQDVLCSTTAVEDENTNVSGSRNPRVTHPFCFCFHCGIGTKRVMGCTQRIQDSDHPSVDGGELTASYSYCDQLNNALDNSGQQQSNTPEGISSAISSTNSKDLASEAFYFSDLSSLHTHENRMHQLTNCNQIACPWCEIRLSYLNQQDICRTLSHLKCHLRQHRLAAWLLDRHRRWTTNLQDLMHCSCGSALIDSPLSLISHASAHLLTSDPNAFINCYIPEHLPGGITNDRRSSNSTKQALLPIPGSHIPCSMEVHRHLRFARFPELDYYLNHAPLLMRPFVCPLCPTSLSTRWALTEHAYFHHWGLMCYICCTYVANSVQSALKSQSRSDESVAALNDEYYVTHDGKHIEHDLSRDRNFSRSLFSPPPPALSLNQLVSDTTTPFPIHESICSTSSAAVVTTDSISACPTNNASMAVSPVPNGTDCTNTFIKSNADNIHNPSTREDLGSDDAIWSHIFHCMLQRRHALINMHEKERNDAYLINSLNARDCEIKETEIQEDLIKKNNNKPHFNSSEVPILIDSSPENAFEVISGDISTLSATEDASPSRATECGKRSKKRLRALSETDNVEDGETTVIHSIIHRPDEHSCLRSDEKHSTDISFTKGSSKLKRIMLEDGPISPVSSHHSERSGSHLGDDESISSPKSTLCILCGELQTPDTWEEHSMLHRNPQMSWNGGIQLAQPNRIVMSKNSGRVYKCYICGRRFVTRAVCQRHMIGQHQLSRSDLNWDLLKDNSDTTQKLVRRLRSSQEADVFNFTSSAEASITTLSGTRSSNSRRNPSDVSGTHRSSVVESLSSNNTNNLDNQQHHCTICDISFVSQRSLSIHQTAAHGPASSKRRLTSVF